MKNTLTLKQERFVSEYLVDGNGSAAYQRAGYTGTGNTAEVEASKLLRNPKIQTALALRRQALAKKVELCQEDVVREMKLLALSSIDHYCVDDQGHVTVAPGAPPEALRAVSSIKHRVIHRETEKEKTVIYQTELRLWDKPSMIQAAARYLHMFDEKSEPTTINNNYMVFIEELKALGRKLEAIEVEYTKEGYEREHAARLAQEAVKRQLTQPPEA